MVLSFRMLKVKATVNSKKMSRKKLFTTSRLIIDQLNDFFEDNETQIIKDIKMLFNPEVLEFLPSDWKNIKTEDQVENWLKRQLKESDLCFVELKGEKKIIGLLFLYYSKDNSDTLNIGYLLNKQYWGKGYASELWQVLKEIINNQLVY
ncbi:N-acetyltransferase [Zooshikella ganghwensis]|uniref:N-acetyltransferase n=2 Tax=Zooshikella ganghwensis TaxID=202772 RepID=A0A4P9VT77_9GAMM|nr:N-acetyltransferase [Zooshikella ganghwensis]